MNLSLKFKVSVFKSAFYLIQDHLYGRYNFHPFIFFVLNSFEMELDYFHIHEGYVIKKINDIDRLNNGYFYRIEKDEKYEIVFNYDLGITYNKTGDYIRKYYDDDVKISRLINGLKIYKEGIISIRKKYNYRFGSNDGLLGEKFIQPFTMLNPYYYNKYIIKKSEIKTMKKFVSSIFKIYQNNDLRNMMEIPIERFCEINDATNLISRLIDLYISLESMFSINEELLGHKMFNRISFLLRKW